MATLQCVAMVSDVVEVLCASASGEIEFKEIDNHLQASWFEEEDAEDMVKGFELISKTISNAGVSVGHGEGKSIELLAVTVEEGIERGFFN